MSTNIYNNIVHSSQEGGNRSNEHQQMVDFKNVAYTYNGNIIQL